MNVYINMVTGEPDWASLPVAKITNYPEEDWDYRPFAQAQLALSDAFLYLRFLSFEVQPDPKSTICAAFLLSREPKTVLALRCYPDITRADVALVRCAANGSWQPVPGVLSPEFCPVASEDLQGIYWGAQAKLALSELRAICGEDIPFRPGSKVLGNLFKLCQDPNGSRAHFGTLFFGAAYDILDTAGYGEIKIVSY